MWQPAHLDICVSADGKSERKKASYTQRLCVSAIDAKGNTWATSYICQCEAGPLYITTQPNFAMLLAFAWRTLKIILF